MAGTPTTNYALPTYAATDSPSLTTGYNAAMAKIDTQMKANATAAANAASAASTAQSTANTANSTANTNKTNLANLTTRVSTAEGSISTLQSGSFAPSNTDKVLTVDQLAKVKVTSNGIVYVPQS